MDKEIQFTTSETAFAFIRLTDVPKYYLKHPPEYLSEAIRIMKPGDPLHELLKEELTAIHHWKAQMKNREHLQCIYWKMKSDNQFCILSNRLDKRRNCSLHPRYKCDDIV